MSSVHNVMTQSIFFYWSLKHFYDETKYSKEDEGFLKSFELITEEEWSTIHKLEALSISVAKYSMFEAQMSCIMASWIHYMRKDVHELLRKKVSKY